MYAAYHKTIIMKITSKKQSPQSFTVNIDNIGYDVIVTPMMINDEKRFVIRINNSADHIYAWDEQIQSLRALDDEASAFPAALEKAISDKLMPIMVLH